MDEHHNRKLLLIEDDPDLQEIIKAFFRPKGFKVIIFSDALEALAAIEKGDLLIDVVITDLKLPNISGIEFIHRMKQTHPDTPIILITAHTSVETAVEAIQAGAYDFVVKPLHFPQLHISVLRALHLAHLQEENVTLKKVVEVQMGLNVSGVIAKSEGMKNALELARRVAASNANVLITGESGTGKEVVARAIHNLSPRKKAPFVAINCSAIPENLLESELFGFVKGAFTGASEKKIGLFEEAEGGTLFLDEIGDLSLSLQAKLLRVLQERKIKRLGENQFRDIDVRVLSATHKDLRKEIDSRSFREDLYFRLNVIPISIPPLRERPEDILPLAEFFLKKFSAINPASPAKSFSKSAKEQLLNLNWRGNVRELENAVERAVVLSTAAEIDATDLPEVESYHLEDVGLPLQAFDQNTDYMTLEELSKKYIHFVLEKNKGAKEQTAKILGIDRKTLYRKLQEMVLVS